MSNSSISTLRPAGQPAEDPLTDLLRQGARQLITQAVEAELQTFLKQYDDLKHEGKPAVIRNGYLPERSIQTGIGSVTVRVPKVRDRSGSGNKFNSMLVPPYLRRTRCLDELLPWLYLKGISTGDFQDALQSLLGSQGRESVTSCREPSEEPLDGRLQAMASA